MNENTPLRLHLRLGLLDSLAAALVDTRRVLDSGELSRAACWGGWYENRGFSEQPTGYSCAVCDRETTRPVCTATEVVATLLGGTYATQSIGWHFVGIYFNEMQSTVANVFGLI